MRCRHALCTPRLPHAGLPVVGVAVVAAVAVVVVIVVGGAVGGVVGGVTVVASVVVLSFLVFSLVFSLCSNQTNGVGGNRCPSPACSSNTSQTLMHICL